MELGFLLAGDVLLITGLIVILRNKFPYTRTAIDPPVDEQMQSRRRLGQLVLLGGIICQFVAHAVRWWP